MKNNRANLILKTTVLASVLVFVIGVLIYGLSTGFGISDLIKSPDNGLYDVPYTYEEEAKTLRAVHVDWIDGPVSVKFYNGSTIQVVETAKKELAEDEKLYLEISGGELSVRWNSAWVHIGFLREEAKKLEILIPQAFEENLETVEIETVSGNVMVDGLELTEAKFESVSGELFLSNITAEEFRAATTSGDIHCEAVSGTENFEAESISGDMELAGVKGGETVLDSTSGAITLTGTAAELKCSTVSGNAALDLTNWPEALRFDSVSGSAEILAPEAADGFLCRFDSVSGDFNCGFRTQKSGKLYQNGDGKCSVQFETTSGDVSLNEKVG